MRDTPKETLATVQALRFVAAALVLCTHATLYVRDRLDPSLPVWHQGAVGVDVFFVISGLVMVLSTAGLASTPANGWAFLQRRLVRVAPMYWLATSVKLAVVLTLPAAALHTAFDLGNVVGSYLFVPTRDASGAVKPLHGVGWTLMHEMYFYALFALGLALRCSPIAFSGVAIAIACVAGAVTGSDTAAARVYLHPMNLLFVAGMLLGLWVRRGVTLPAWAGLLLFVGGGVLLLWPGPHAAVRDTLGGFDLLAVAVVAGAVVLERSIGPKVPRVLLALGDSSYSLYIFHPLLGSALAAVLVAVGLRGTVVAWLSIVLCAIVVCHVIHHVLERPLHRRLRPWTATLAAPR